MLSSDIDNIKEDRPSSVLNIVINEVSNFEILIAFTYGLYATHNIEFCFALLVRFKLHKNKLFLSNFVKDINLSKLQVEFLFNKSVLAGGHMSF